ncbi:MAG: hypothetical protein KGZ83_22205 [Sulfuricella sp.]|nr:hypothetical protein [Sulfuricella sp.]
METAAAAMTPEAFFLKRVKALISGRTGIHVREQDDGALQTLLRERMRLLKLSSPEEYYRFLDSGEGRQQEQEQLATRLTTGETYFFRDKGQFALLKNTLLPELIERRGAIRSLRIWSAGCASGEEAYSLAMLLDELLPQRTEWNLFILGTDIDPEAIEKARRGIYTQWSFRMVDDGLQRKYFHPRREQWALSERIRSMVTFRTGNLLRAVPGETVDFRDMDLILCRNVFIYLAPNAVSRIAANLADALAGGGYLVTGHGELHPHQLGKLRTRIFAESVAYQRNVECGIRNAEFKPESMTGGLSIPHSTIRNPHLEARRPAANMANPGVANGGGAASSQSPIPNLQSRMKSAWLHANLGELEQAANDCRQAFKTSPLDAEPYYLLAQIAEERGNPGEAKALLKKVIYLDPAFIAAYLELAGIYERENDATRARKMRATAQDLLGKMPGDASLALLGNATAGELLSYLVKQKDVA